MPPGLFCGVAGHQRFGSEAQICSILCRRQQFKAFRSAARIIAGIETMHMIKKGQLRCPEGQRLSAAEQFYSLAF